MNLQLEVDSLKNKVTNLEQLPLNSHLSVYNSVNETYDRLRQSKNILVFNVPDKLDENSDNTIHLATIY